MNKFANILFAGKCNAFCPDCIGKQIRQGLNKNNLTTRPLENIDKFIDIINTEEIKEVSLTGTITDPLLYKYQKELIECLRDQIEGVKLSLHTNGRLIKKVPDIFNMYDRAAISIPSFNEDIYSLLMGTGGVPDLEYINNMSHIPIKISTLVNTYNLHTIPEFIEECYQKGVKRLVLRKLFGEQRSLAEMIHLDTIARTYIKDFMNNAVYNYKGMEITLRGFESTENISYNLFADGTISDQYLLQKA